MKQGSAEKLTKQLIQSVAKAYDAAMPGRVPSRRSLSCYWWSGGNKDAEAKMPASPKNLPTFEEKIGLPGAVFLIQTIEARFAESDPTKQNQKL